MLLSFSRSLGEFLYVYSCSGTSLYFCTSRQVRSETNATLVGKPLDRLLH